MSEEINNYNRTFENKATQELQAQQEKLQSVGEKYANFKQDLQKEIAKNMYPNFSSNAVVSDLILFSNFNNCVFSSGCCRFTKFSSVNA
jgi:hypothetical protein